MTPNELDAYDTMTDTPETDLNNTAGAVAQERLFNRLKNYVRDMDARITIARVEIREKQAAVGQLEQEKWKLESEVDKIAAMISSANDKDLARERWYVRPELLKLFPWCNAKEMSSADEKPTNQ